MLNITLHTSIHGQQTSKQNYNTLQARSRRLRGEPSDAGASTWKRSAAARLAASGIVCSCGFRQGDLAKVAPSKREGPVTGTGQLELASLRQAAVKVRVCLRQAVREDLKR